MTLNEWAAFCRLQNDKWWRDLETGKPLVRNKGELLCLIHSEISEVLEGVRKNAMDSHLPHRRAEEVEMADAFIRMMDYCGEYGLDIEGAVLEKMDYNANRADHKSAARRAVNGKKF